MEFPQGQTDAIASSTNGEKMEKLPLHLPAHITKSTYSAVSADIQPVSTALSIYTTLTTGNLGDQLLEEGLLQIPLPETEFEELCGYLVEDPNLSWIAKRLEYNPFTQSVRITAPTVQHEVVTDGTRDLLRDAVKALQVDENVPEDVRSCLSKIRTSGSRGIILSIQERSLERSPDFSFFVLGDLTTRLIGEISHAEKYKDLLERGPEWVKGQAGGCELVIGIDMSYQRDGKLKDMEARLIVWKAKRKGKKVHAEQVLDELIRDRDGNQVEGVRYQLYLQDFVSPDAMGNCENYPIVNITGEALCKIIEEAEMTLDQVKKNKQEQHEKGKQDKQA